MTKAKKTFPRKNDFFYYAPWDVNDHVRGDMNSYLVFLGRYRVPLWLGLTSGIILLASLFVVSVFIDMALGLGGWFALNSAIVLFFTPMVLFILASIIVGLAGMVKAWRKVMRGGSTRVQS